MSRDPKSSPLAERLVPLESLRPGQVAILGIGSDHASSFLRGCAEAPARILEALFSGASNLCAESGVDLDGEARLVLAGNLVRLPEDERFVGHVEEAASAALAGGGRLLSLGGDHAISYPLVRAHHRRHGPLAVLHLDAHPDLYDELDGSRLSHACPFARIAEEGLSSRLVQVGIRTANPHQQAQAERFGVETVAMSRFDEAAAVVASLRGPLYLSLDLDVLDPAYAPGVSHWEPGGASVRQVVDLLAVLGAPPVGADLVELNPRRDPSGRTAAVAAKLLKEMAVAMLRDA